MKKLTKSIVSLTLVVVMLVCFCGTAFAATTLWGRYFPLLQQGTQSDYNYGLQAILYRYNDSTHGYIVDAGGIDGAFGEGTTNAVKAFQAAKGLTADGLVGENTWDSLYYSLQYINDLLGHTFYCVADSSGRVYRNETAISRYLSNGITTWSAHRENTSKVSFASY